MGSKSRTGRLKYSFYRLFIFNRPYRTQSRFFALIPSDESLGYFQMSLPGLNSMNKIRANPFNPCHPCAILLPLPPPKILDHFPGDDNFFAAFCAAQDIPVLQLAGGGQLAGVPGDGGALQQFVRIDFVYMFFFSGAADFDFVCHGLILCYGVQ